MARQVSDEAFSEFVHGAWPGLYRTAYLLLGDAGLAEDLVQTALAKTYAAWPSVRDVRAAPGFAAVGAPRARCRTGCRPMRSYGYPASPTRAERVSGRSLSIRSHHRRRTW
jgi:hypothetical protein